VATSIRDNSKERGLARRRFFATSISRITRIVRFPRIPRIPTITRRGRIPKIPRIPRITKIEQEEEGSQGVKGPQGSQEEEGERLGKEDTGGNEDPSKAQVKVFIVGNFCNFRQLLLLH